jgi:hypothetical protein
LPSRSETKAIRPEGVGVGVGVGLGVGVGVGVGVGGGVGVDVEVGVEVDVGVAVEVTSGVDVDVVPGTGAVAEPNAMVPYRLFSTFSLLTSGRPANQPVHPPFCGSR